MAHRLGSKIAVGDTDPVSAWPASTAWLTLIALPHPMPENLDPAGCVIEPSECQQIVVHEPSSGRYYTLGFAFRNEAMVYALAVTLTHHSPADAAVQCASYAVLAGGL